MTFLLTYIDLRTVNFYHLLNPDWSIQISRAPAVCKEGVIDRIQTLERKRKLSTVNPRNSARGIYFKFRSGTHLFQLFFRKSRPDRISFFVVMYAVCVSPSEGSCLLKLLKELRNKTPLGDLGTLGLLGSRQFMMVANFSTEKFTLNFEG